jgi:hypothetical protein
MRPLRRRRIFAHLALFALAMQFVAAFGHAHAHPAPGQNIPLASRIFFSPVPGTCLPGLPEHLECTVCVAMNLLGSSAMPQAAPELGLALRLASMLSGGCAVRAPPLAVTASFLARGPPVSDLT